MIKPGGISIIIECIYLCKGSLVLQKILIYNLPVLMLLAKGFLPLDARFTRFCANDVSLALSSLSNWHVLT